MADAYAQYAKLALERYDKDLAEVVAAIHRLADAVEQEGQVDDFEGVAGARHTMAAARVVRLVVSRTSNHLDLDRLIRNAGTADGVEAGAIIESLGGTP